MDLGRYGRWAFAEFTDVYDIEAELERAILNLIDSSKNIPTENFPNYDYGKTQLQRDARGRPIL